MAKLNNEQARLTVERDYNGRKNGMLYELKFYGGSTIPWSYYDEQYNKPHVIKDMNGNVVGRCEV